MEDLSCADESLISNYFSKTPMSMKLDCRTFQTEKLCLLRKFEISEEWDAWFHSLATRPRTVMRGIVQRFVVQ